MTEDYMLAVISVAKKKIEITNKPTSEAELIRGVVHLLKKKLGKDNPMHTSKARFKKEIFRQVIETEEWRTNIAQMPDGKFVLKANYSSVDLDTLVNDLSFSDRNYEEAVEKVLSILKKINVYMLEELVKNLLKKQYNYDFEVTKKSGDGGVDVIGTRIDKEAPEKQEKMFVQVKRYSKSVGREYADKFIGSVTSFRNNNDRQFSKITALFISTGSYPDSFLKQLSDNSKTGIYFESWDGKKLTENLIKSGMGVKYSVDLNFWEKADPTLIPKVSRNKN